ncbi:MAG: hypothetical protein C4575_03585 [Desulforudis sp.]|nr:MAG: hypothetical protein C4575_03585 [Desulforudis sp.]
MIANNPSTAAIALAIDENAVKQKLADICLLSIGTGFFPQQIVEDTTDWGAVQWVLNLDPPVPLITVLFDGMVRADVLFSSQLLGGRYFRLNPTLPKAVSLDDYKQVPHLVSLAQDYELKPAMDWITRNWF